MQQKSAHKEINAAHVRSFPNFKANRDEAPGSAADKAHLCRGHKSTHTAPTPGPRQSWLLHFLRYSVRLLSIKSFDMLSNNTVQ